jgi:hypothetical protein
MQMLADFKTILSFSILLKKLRKSVDDGELDDSRQETVLGIPRDVANVIRGALDDRTLLRNLEYVELLEKETAKLKEMPTQFSGSSAGQRIMQDIETAKTVAIDNTGNLARSRYERLLSEIQDFLNQTTRVEIEILKALRGELEDAAATGEERAQIYVDRDKVESSPEHVLWPFRGEFWRDELGYYRQPVDRHCGR